VLQVGAALEQEQGPAALIDGTLKRGYHDGGGNKPTEAPCVHAQFLLGLVDPAVEHAG
jgi:hypothetical protein